VAFANLRGHRPRERLADKLNQGCRRKGLLQNEGFRESLAQVASGKFGLTGHECDADVRPDCFQLRREFAAAHLGHDHVTQKKVNRTAM
jgi:hypothetical protein